MAICLLDGTIVAVLLYGLYGGIKGIQPLAAAMTRARTTSRATHLRLPALQQAATCSSLLVCTAAVARAWLIP